MSTDVSNTGHAGKSSRTYFPDPIEITSAHKEDPVIYGTTAETHLVSPEFRPGRSVHPSYNNVRDFSLDEEISPHSHRTDFPPSAFNVNQGQRYDRGSGASEIDQSGESSNDCKSQLIYCSTDLHYPQMLITLKPQLSSPAQSQMTRTE